MTIPRRGDTLPQLLGWSGLLLAIAGAVGIIALGGNVAIAIGMLLPLMATAALLLLPAMRDTPAIWLVSAIWTGAIGVFTIFSVGMIFLIATVFLLAAFVRANW